MGVGAAAPGSELDARVRAVSFTGSTEIGRLIAGGGRMPDRTLSGVRRVTPGTFCPIGQRSTIVAASIILSFLPRKNCGDQISSWVAEQPVKSGVIASSIRSAGSDLR